MRRTLYLAYGLTCHGLFLAVYAYLACFVADFLVPKTVDVTLPGDAVLSAPFALAIDLGLLALFGLQHSVMARPAFKRWWTKIVPAPIERSTYVLASNIVVAAAILLWQPLPGVVWDVTAEPARTILWGLFVCSWLSIPVYTLMINHFDLFGSRQVWQHFRGRRQQGLAFGTPGVYRFIRHPIYLGWMMAFWITPTMTVGHLVWAAGMTAYMLLAIPMEEKDLVAEFGTDYLRYRNRVPALVPVPGKGVRDVADLRGERTA